MCAAVEAKRVGMADRRMGLMRFCVRYGLGGEYVEDFTDAAFAFDFAAHVAAARVPGWIDPCVEELIDGPPTQGRMSEHG